MMYVAGWNMAGYLPETDPETFENLEDATAYLRETVERWLDEDESTDPRTAAEIVETGPGWADGWYEDYHLWAEPIP